MIILGMQLPEDTIGNTSNGSLADDIRSTNENLSDTAWMSRENGNAKSLVKRYDFEINNNSSSLIPS